MMKTKCILLALAFVCLSYFSIGQTTWTNLSYNPDVPNIERNPMKGWMPGYTSINTDFPYSIDHFYIKLKDVYTGWGQCDWTAFETQLDRITSGGRHVVTRFWIDYPNQVSGMPDFLLPVVTMYDENSPDWNDEDLMLAMLDFIALLGAQYDGDPRIAMIEAGLYGYWGEWHTYPENSWAMTQVNKDRLLDAYTAAFSTTHIGLRQSNHASTYERKMSFAYYDDSFAYNTLCTGSWCFWNGNIVPDGITDIYQYHPIAGELRPEIQKTIFETIPNGTANGEEDLETCINTTHLSFMKAYFLFNGYWDANLGQRIYPTQTEKDNALVSHKMMGYEFYVRSTRIVPQTNGNVFIELNLQNRGVAPMYYDWQVEFAAKNIASGQIYNIGTADWNISGILPTSTDFYKSATTLALADGSYKILMRLKNPLEDINANAFPLRFANTSQDADVNGWLTLGTADVSIGGDEITNFVAPSQVTGGDAFTAEVTYSATTTRDIRVFVQLNSSPWTMYGATTVPVGTGNGIKTVSVNVDPAIPLATDAYKIVANLLPTGGAWVDRLDEAIITGVDAVSPLSSDSRLSDLTVDGVTVSGFTPEVFSYNIELPSGTVLVPLVAAVTFDANATSIVTHASALPGSTSVLVTAEDGLTTTSYTVNFTVAAIDEITSFIAPNQVTAGESFTATVSYTATVTRDIRVFLQLNSDPWTTYGATTVKVAQGSGSINVNVALDPATPAASAAYKIAVNLLPEGGAWPDRLDESIQTGVDVLSSVCIDDLPWSDANFSVTKATVTYSSGLIDISCASSATISVDLEGVGPMERQDYCNVYFKVDGGAQQVLSENSNSFPLKTVTALVSGSSLEIFVNAKTNFADETYHITNLMVTAGGLKSGQLIDSEIIDSDEEMEIEIYPNPVSETLYVENHQKEKILIRFFNLQGKLLYAAESEQERTVIDVKDLKYKGLVMMQLVSGEQCKSHRILVK